MPDGLSQMRQAREAASRRGSSRNIPPSRKKPPTTKVDIRPEPAQTEMSPANEMGVSVAAPAPSAASGEMPRTFAEGPGRKSSAGESTQRIPALQELVKKTIYLSTREDDFLEDVYLAGRRAPGGKVDANRGAVVRLALRRLEGELSPEQIVEEIRAGITRPAAGRPRF